MIYLAYLHDYHFISSIIINIIQTMIKTIAIYLCLLVSVSSLSASPTWTRDIQIDSGTIELILG